MAEIKVNDMEIEIKERRTKLVGEHWSIYAVGTPGITGFVLYNKRYKEIDKSESLFIRTDDIPELIQILALLQSKLEV